jgi:anti-sigma regulatory factor (Ser/Thr protein kinase)/DNA-binding XRE family transcriptional regulator
MLRGIVTAAQAPPAWCRTFPATPHHVRDARQFLAAILDGHPATDEAVLCLSELVTNSVLHSASARPGGTFRIRASLRAGALRVEVEDDGGPWRSATSHDTDGGHGLVIVDALARNWGMAKNGNVGRAIWFEIRCWTTAVDGHRLRHLRRERGLTRAGLAAKAGISQATIARLERQRRASSRGRTVARLAAALGEQPATLALPAPQTATTQGDHRPVL